MCDFDDYWGDRWGSCGAKTRQMLWCVRLMWRCCDDLTRWYCKITIMWWYQGYLFYIYYIIFFIFLLYVFLYKVS
jgi:hypothetical protein